MKLLKDRRETGDGEKSGDALDSFCVNLNQKARDGKIDPLIGREAEVNRTIQVLCRRSKNNPLLVGDPGVGKTALPKAWRARSSMAKCRKCSRTAPSSSSTWACCWPARAIAAISKNA
jgi:replication-associated recombination protein RarA